MLTIKLLFVRQTLIKIINYFLSVVFGYAPFIINITLNHTNTTLSQTGSYSGCNKINYECGSSASLIPSWQ